jgi:predicted nucleotidyltransferase
MAIQHPSGPRWDGLRDRRGRVRLSMIRRVARRIAERFQPDKIILFGSYAYGRPDRDSDVDLLVVMPARNEIDQALRIWKAIDPPFALDVIVRTPRNLRWRLEEGDSFLREVVGQGKVLHEKVDEGVGQRCRSRDRQGAPGAARSLTLAALTNAVRFSSRSQ